MQKIKSFLPACAIALMFGLLIAQAQQLKEITDQVHTVKEQLALISEEQEQIQIELDNSQSLEPTANKLSLELAKKSNLNQELIMFDIPLSPELQNHMLELDKKYLADAQTVIAIIEHESQFIDGLNNYNANGSIDTGLAQINSCNWSWLAEKGIDVHTSTGNIEACFYILSEYLKKGYTHDQALRAYAVGEAGMLSGGGQWFVDELEELRGEF